MNATAQQAGPDTSSLAPEWVAAEDMHKMPAGWYWASFPGGWEFFKPERNATLGIDHGHNGWQPLMSTRYWGPFQPTDVREAAAAVTE